MSNLTCENHPYRVSETIYRSVPDTDNRQRYIEYLNKHIEAVNTAWNDILKPDLIKYRKTVGELSDEYISDGVLNNITNNIKHHDATSFMPDEMSGTMNSLFPSDSSKDNSVTAQMYECARNLHYLRNNHHWQHWLTFRSIDGIGSVEMTFSAICHMLCYYSSSQFTQDKSMTAHLWWSSFDPTDKIHPTTCVEIERLLRISPKL